MLIENFWSVSNVMNASIKGLAEVDGMRRVSGVYFSFEIHALQIIYAIPK